MQMALTKDGHTSYFVELPHFLTPHCWS